MMVGRKRSTIAAITVRLPLERGPALLHLFEQQRVLERHRDLARHRLEQALAERSGGLYGIKASFLFAPLRGQPRFEALLKQLNLE